MTSAFKKFGGVIDFRRLPRAEESRQDAVLSSNKSYLIRLLMAADQIKAALDDKQAFKNVLRKHKLLEVLGLLRILWR